MPTMYDAYQNNRVDIYRQQEHAPRQIVKMNKRIERLASQAPPPRPELLSPSSTTPTTRRARALLRQSNHATHLH